MAFRGKVSNRTFVFVAAALLCVIAGLAVGRLPLLLARGAPAQIAAHDPPTQGVKVHGWWTIDVFSGTRLVSTRQFENACLTVNQIGNAEPCSFSSPAQLTSGYRESTGRSMSAAPRRVT